VDKRAAVWHFDLDQARVRAVGVVDQGASIWERDLHKADFALIRTVRVVNESASVGENFLLEADIVRVIGVGGDHVGQIGLEIPVNRAISICGWFEANAQVEISWKVRGDGLDVVEQGVLRDGVKVLLDWIPANKTLLRVSIALSGCGTLSSCSALSGCAFGIELAVCLLDKIWDIPTHPIHKICQDSLVADAI
jgi:hypothetical protein